MAIVTKFASTNAVVTTGWTNPTNAYADDENWATASPGKNLTVNSDFGFADFSTSDIPDGARINTVKIYARFDTSATTTLITEGIQGRVAGANSGTEATRTGNTTDSELVTTLGTVTLTQLRAASTTIYGRARSSKGSTNTGYTSSLDYVYIEVDYTRVGTGSITIDAVLKKVVSATDPGWYPPASSSPTNTIYDPSGSNTYGVGLAFFNNGSGAVVGEYGYNSSTGRAFVVSGSDLKTLVATLQSPIPTASDWFGYKVAASSDGSIIAVSATYDNGDATDGGRVYVFSGTNYETVTTLSPSDPAASTRFGYGLAMSSDGSVIVAAKSDSSLYIFYGTNWGSQIKKSGGGFTVAVSDDGTVVVGGNYTYSSNYGQVNIYSGTTWGTTTTKNGSGGAYRLGCGVATNSDGTIVAATAPYATYSGMTSHGVIRIYTGASWGTTTEVIRSRSTASYFYYQGNGGGLAMNSDGTVIVGGGQVGTSGGVDIYYGSSWSSYFTCFDYTGLPLMVAVNSGGTKVLWHRPNDVYLNQYLDGSPFAVTIDAVLAEGSTPTTEPFPFIGGGYYP